MNRHKRRRPIRWPAVALIIHNWLGLKLFLVLSVVLLSGTLAVYRYEIDWLIYPELRVEPGPSLATLDEIAAAVGRAYPEAGIGAEIPTGAGAGNLAIGIIGIFPDRGIRLIWVDPYRAVVQGDTSLLTPGAFLAKLHRDLFAEDWGLLIVCAFAIVLLLSLVTGLIAYRRFWRGFLRRPRFRTLRIAMVDLHKLIGLWSLWFTIVITFTGLWYFWTLVGEPMFGFPAAMDPRPQFVLDASRLDALGPQAPARVSLDAALAAAKARYPDFVSTYVSLPEHHGAPIVFHGNRGEALALNATMIAVDPFSGAIVDQALARDASVANRIAWMVNPLHYGDFGGMVSKTVWFLFGLAMSSLAVTGIVIYWCRVTAPLSGAAAIIQHAFHPWRGAMGWMKPLHWLVLAVSVYAVGATASYYGSAIADAPVRLAAQAVGPWRLGVTLVAGFGRTAEPLQPGRAAIAFVEYCDVCWERIRRVWIETGGGAAQEVRGRPGLAFTRVMLPQSSGQLTLVAEGWDGKIHRSSWKLDLTQAALD